MKINPKNMIKPNNSALNFFKITAPFLEIIPKENQDLAVTIHYLCYNKLLEKDTYK